MCATQYARIQLFIGTTVEVETERLHGGSTAIIVYVLVGLPANAKHRRTWKSNTHEMF